MDLQAALDSANAAMKEHAELDDASLGDVAKLCNSISDFENVVATLEGELKDAKIRLNNLLTREIPDALAEIGLSEVKLTNGRTVSSVPFYSARIMSDKRDQAITWLLDNEYDHVVKSDVIVSFQKDMLDEMLELTSELEGRDYNAGTKFAVHPQTLTKLVRENPEIGLPDDMFEVFIGQKARIK